MKRILIIGFAVLIVFIGSSSIAYAQTIEFLRVPNSNDCANFIANYTEKTINSVDNETIKRERPYWHIVGFTYSIKDDFGSNHSIVAVCRYIYLKETKEFAFDSAIDDGKKITSSLDTSGAGMIQRLNFMSAVTKSIFGKETDDLHIKTTKLYMKGLLKIMKQK